jgi:hypothetical protein
MKKKKLSSAKKDTEDDLAAKTEEAHALLAKIATRVNLTKAKVRAEGNDALHCCKKKRKEEQMDGELMWAWTRVQES